MMDVRLREVTANDGIHIVNWRGDEAVKNHLMNKKVVTLDSNEEFYRNNIETGKYKQFMVEKLVDNYPVIYTIATVYLKNIDINNARCELGLFTNSDEEWNDEAKQEAIKQLMNKAFHDYKMKKIYTYVIADCKDEIELMESVGFIQEGHFKSEISGSFGRRDVLRFGICDEENNMMKGGCKC